MGDKVLSVNGVNLIGADHYEAVEVLRRAGGSLTLIVLREVTKTSDAGSNSSTPTFRQRNRPAVTGNGSGIYRREDKRLCNGREEFVESEPQKGMPFKFCQNLEKSLLTVVDLFFQK